MNDERSTIGPAEAQARAAGRLGRRRLEHSSRVAELAAHYAGLNGASRDEARVVGWLHDICRDLSEEEILRAAEWLGVPVGPLERGHPVGLLHAPVAAAELRAAGLDERLARAIEVHTVGGRGHGRAGQVPLPCRLLRAGARLRRPGQGATARGGVAGQRRWPRPPGSRCSM